MRWIWEVGTDAVHEVRLEVDYLGREKVFVDGVLASRNHRTWTQHNQHLFAVGARHRARLDVHGTWGGRVTCRLLVDGKLVPPLGGGPTQGWFRLVKEMPAWGWPFAAACLAIPAVSLGGAIPAFIGVMGAGICVSLASDRNGSSALRILFASLTTLLSWGAFLGVAYLLSDEPATATATTPTNEVRLDDSMVSVEVTGLEGVASHRSGVIVASETVVTILPHEFDALEVRVRHKEENLYARIRYLDPEHFLAQLEVPGLRGTPAPVGKSSAVFTGSRLTLYYASPDKWGPSRTWVTVESLEPRIGGAQVMGLDYRSLDREANGGGLFDESGRLVGILRSMNRPSGVVLPAEWIELLPGHPVASRRFPKVPDQGSRSVGVRSRATASTNAVRRPNSWLGM